MCNCGQSAGNLFFMFHYFYYTGFCAGEMSCSIIKATNKTGGYYYTPDVTVSNNDKVLLQEINRVIAQERGVISPIKGGYNLSIRGREKVKIALSFFENYPFISGDIVNSKVQILRKAMDSLSEKKQNQHRSSTQMELIEGYRSQLQEMRKTGIPIWEFNLQSISKDAIGYYLCGVADAEGSVGLKRRSETYQAFFSVAMKDKKIIDLFQSFFSYGYIYFRPESGVYHYTTADFRNVSKIVRIFTEVYPSKQQHMRTRLEKLKGILNDHTRDTKQIPMPYDGKLW
jgi:hypothetical protein